MGSDFQHDYDSNSSMSLHIIPTEPFQNSEPSRSPVVLVIEDSDEDYEALRRALVQSSVKMQLHRCMTGQSAIDYLEKSVLAESTPTIPMPALILLDLNLPGMNGHRVLQAIKQNPRLQHFPTVILTTSNNPKDVEACYRSGANGYVCKAMDWKEFKASMQTFVRYWLETIILP
jgi:CheY-like chemotaxis protein